jgi:hypothetical protein
MELQAMSKRLNWERNKYKLLKTSSIKDETEFTNNDLASQWLREREESEWSKFQKDRATAAHLKELGLTDKQITRHLHGQHSSYQPTSEQRIEREQIASRPRRKRKTKIKHAKRIGKPFEQLNPRNPHHQLPGVDLEYPPWK